MPEQSGSRPTLEQQLQQAEEFIRAGQADSAVGLCESLVEEYPEDGHIWAALGDAYAGCGDWVKAVDFYERALDLSFDPAVMERLAAARRHAIRGDQAAPVTPRPAAPVPAARKTGPSTGVLIAVILGIALVPILSILLVRASGGGGGEPDYASSAEDVSMPATADGVAAPLQPTQPATPGPAGAAPGPPASAALPTAGAPQYRAPVGGASTPSTLTRTTAPRSSRPPAAMASDVDRKIMGQLRLERAGAGGLSSRATAMAFDEYAGLGILTLATPSASDPNRLEAELLAAAFYAAANSMRTEPGLRSLIVRALCRVPDDSGRDQDVMVFRAGVTRARLEKWLTGATVPTPQQVRSEILQDIWWDQQAVARMMQPRPEARKEP